MAAGGYGAGGEWDLIFGDQGDARAKAQAIADALRGQQRDALALQALTGGPRAAPQIGQALAANAQQELGGLGQAAQARMNQDLHRATLERQQAQTENMLRHQQAQEEHQRNMENLYSRGLGLRGIRYNPNSGNFERVAGVPPPATATPPPPPQGQGMPPPAPGPRAPTPAVPLPSPAGPGRVPQYPPLAGKMLDKALKELGQDFDPSGGRSGEFGKNQARVNAATRLLQLATDENGQPKDLNPQQMPELSQALASLISGGGQGAQAQIEHLTPHTLRGNLQGTLQWLTGNPRGADQQAFVANMIETAKREQQVAQQAIEQVRSQRGAKHQRLLRGNPEDARRVLQGFGWDLGPEGLPVQQGAPAPGAKRKRIKVDAEGNIIEG